MILTPSAFLSDLLLAGMPAKVKAFHVVQAYEEGKLECMDFLGFKETKVTGFRLRRYPDRIASDSANGTVRMLESMGFERKYIPHCLGGDYDYKQYAEWTRMRISVEDIMSAIPIASNRLSLVSADRVDAPNRKKKTDTTSDEQTRQHNALKARRSYHRRQLELFSLQEHKRVYELRNEPLRKENAFLEDLLARAEACVNHHLRDDHDENELTEHEVDVLFHGID